MKEYGYYLNLKDILSGSLYGTPFKKGFPPDRAEFFSADDEVISGFISIHTPGHRPDSVSFLEPETGVFISGDFILVLGGKVLVNRYVSSKKDQDDSVQRTRQLKSIRHIYPGHGICRLFDPDSL
jgi:glyoxylase-like metal-dependent hydrolase (beta-lactamase superfamily II)